MIKQQLASKIWESANKMRSKIEANEYKDETYEPLFVDASKHFVKDGKNNKLRACDIRRIVNAVTGSRTIDKFSRLVSVDEIRSTLSSELCPLLLLRFRPACIEAEGSRQHVGL